MRTPEVVSAHRLGHGRLPRSRSSSADLRPTSVSCSTRCSRSRRSSTCAPTSRCARSSRRRRCRSRGPPGEPTILIGEGKYPDRPVPVSTVPMHPGPTASGGTSTDRTRPAGGSEAMSEAVSAGPLAGAACSPSRPDDHRRPEGGVGAAHMTVRTAAIWSGIWSSLRRLRCRALGRALGGRVLLRGVRDGEGAVARQRLRLHADLRRARGPARRRPRGSLGILIALGLRAVSIFLGAEALETYSWVAWRSPPCSPGRAGGSCGRGGARRGRAARGARAQAVPGAQPAVAALITVALADVIFAVDSVPAILASRPRSSSSPRASRCSACARSSSSSPAPSRASTSAARLACRSSGSPASSSTAR